MESSAPHSRGACTSRMPLSTWELKLVMTGSKASLATAAAPILASAIALIMAVVITIPPHHARAAGWGKGHIPNPPVITQDRKMLNLYDGLMQDQNLVINILYADCRDICPPTTARPSALHD